MSLVPRWTWHLNMIYEFLSRIAVLDRQTDRPTTLLTVATHGISWSVCLSVGHVREPCKNVWTDRDAVWGAESGGPKELCIRLGSRSPKGKGQFLGVVRPIEKHWESLLRCTHRGWTDRDGHAANKRPQSTNPRGSLPEQMVEGDPWGTVWIWFTRKNGR